VKVDASKGPIHIGDLLVTSDIPGVAMKSEAVNLGGVQFHRPGTLIGKALEPLEKGRARFGVVEFAVVHSDQGYVNVLDHSDRGCIQRR
jgi:hypothetical protein